jgi:uncharacterized membrane protein
MWMLLVGLAGFVLSHSLTLFAPTLRTQAMTRLGVHGYRAAFSLFSVIVLVLVVLGFQDTRLSSTVLWVAPDALKWVSRVLMLMALILAGCSFGRSHLKHIIKHPQLTAIKTWAFAHLLVNGRVVDLWLFGTLLAWAVMMRVYQKRHPKPQPSLNRTPLLLHDLIGVALGLWIYAFLVLGLHQYLFGLSPWN